MGLAVHGLRGGAPLGQFVDGLELARRFIERLVLLETFSLYE